MVLTGPECDRLDGHRAIWYKRRVLSSAAAVVAASSAAGCWLLVLVLFVVVPERLVTCVSCVEELDSSRASWLVNPLGIECSLCVLVPLLLLLCVVGCASEESWSGIQERL